MDENNEVVDNAPEPNSVEDRARELGWKPAEEFDGPEEKWVEADEFVRRQPLFEKIESEKKARVALEKALELNNKAMRELGEHSKRQAEAGYKRALRELKAERRAALEDGQIVLADEIQERIDELKPEETPEVPEFNPGKQRLDQWMSENKWYTQDVEMREVADGVAKAHFARGGSPEGVFEVIEARIKKLYPDQFGTKETTTRNPNKDDAPPVARSSVGVRGKSPNSTFRPTEEQRRFAKVFVGQGLYKSEAEYYKELSDMGEA